MSKIEEKNGNAELQSAEEVNDREFEQWVKQQFMAEAEAIAKEIDEIPDSEDWEPTEEKFQMLLQKAKEQGTIQSEPDSAQTKVSEDQPKEKSSRTTEETVISEKLNNEKLNIETNKIQNKATHRHKFANVGEKVIKWAAVAAITVFGIFGVSMTSEANRAYIMETVNSMTGSHTETEIDNDEMMNTATTEEEARENIAEVLNITIPRFFYWPSGYVYEDCTIDTAAQTAIIQYVNDGNALYFMIIANEKSKSLLATSDLGRQVEKVSSELMEGIHTVLWEVMDEGDQQPTYILQWEYKNVYYELSGKILDSEMEEIAKNIIY